MSDRSGQPADRGPRWRVTPPAANDARDGGADAPDAAMSRAESPGGFVSISRVQQVIVKGSAGAAAPSELPAELRAEIEKLRREGKVHTTMLTGRLDLSMPGGATQITIRGPDGKSRTYDSVDAMPPEDRKLYESIRTGDLDGDGRPDLPGLDRLLSGAASASRLRMRLGWPALLLAGIMGGALTYWLTQ